MQSYLIAFRISLPMSPSSLKIVCISAFCLLLFWQGCASYNKRIESYYTEVSEGNYDKANSKLEHISLLKKDRNQLLYFLEKGKITHSLAQYKTSNNYFNQADRYMEESRLKGKDLVAGTLINPMMQKYLGEDFEKYMIHYYKALNYLYLGQPEEAVVEARRITLLRQQQEGPPGRDEKHYSQDAFSMMLQGLIYESANDINNAFIAYRNAAETYLKNKDQIYYGVQMPVQLKKDLLRTAYQNGFMDELSRFEKILNMQYVPQKPPEGGTLIVFWENGLAPVKDQQDLVFSLVRREGGFYFMDRNGGEPVPFQSTVFFSDDQFERLRLSIFHVSFPKYRLMQPLYYSAWVNNGIDSLPTEKAEDINELAVLTLKQRYLKEISLALSRLAVKKAAELAVRGKDHSSKKDKEIREGIAGALQAYNVFSEKADTRNWQSLPASISYARFPLAKGTNKLSIVLQDVKGRKLTHSFSINGTGNLVFYNYSSPTCESIPLLW